MYDRLLGSDHAEALVSIKMAEKSDFGQTRDLKGPGSSARAQVEKKKPPRVTTGEAFLPPLQWRPHEHKEKQVHSPATNQPFVSQRQEVFRNTAENKHNYFPGLYIQAAGTAGARCVSRQFWSRELGEECGKT